MSELCAKQNRHSFLFLNIAHASVTNSLAMNQLSSSIMASAGINIHSDALVRARTAYANRNCAVKLAFDNEHTFHLPLSKKATGAAQSHSVCHLKNEYAEQAQANGIISAKS